MQFKMKLVVSIVIFSIFSQCNSKRTDTDGLNTVTLIQSYGYPVEVHTVETKDGYLLQMHRIPYGIKNNPFTGGQTVRTPVFYSHGLFGSSGDIVLLGPDRSLAFILADAGYDVWLGNMRGNTYSRNHTYLSPETNKFWDYSWHESGVYDLPAQIDHILNTTGMEKIIYTGISMGTTTFFVMASTLPEYNDKIELALLMAPVAYGSDVLSPVARLLNIFGRLIKAIDDAIAHGEILQHTKELEDFGKLLCTPTKAQRLLCESLIFLVTGANPEELDENMLELYLEFYPAGYAVKGMRHFGQGIETGEFKQYDYGPYENMVRYGSSRPPKYNLGAITAEVNFYVAPNDLLATEPDINRLAVQLPNLRKVRRVAHPRFNHADFGIAKHAKELVYDIMLQDIQDHYNALGEQGIDQRYFK